MIDPTKPSDEYFANVFYNYLKVICDVQSADFLGVSLLIPHIKDICDKWEAINKERLVERYRNKEPQ